LFDQVWRAARGDSSTLSLNALLIELGRIGRVERSQSPLALLLPPTPRLGTLGRCRKKIAYVHGGEMKNPLDSLWGTVISGLVLTVILYYVVKFALQ
jgi:hypothetical protein